ncbi:hypothetical protein VM1G_12076 [Cytospora mali]|uniref:Uncharacterized protein n=1 Tax=Cytospora mali TaxID=578113 RepID=A0A194VJJ7_CYTMA|nr:hypothetical protein VM1G_12076 [Valsa mali]
MQLLYLLLECSPTSISQSPPFMFLTVPTLAASPSIKTKVSLCYGKSFIHIRFTALGEENFYYNSSISTNGEIYNYEVMEAFISNDETSFGKAQ